MFVTCVTTVVGDVMVTCDRRETATGVGDVIATRNWRETATGVVGTVMFSGHRKSSVHSTLRPVETANQITCIYVLKHFSLTHRLISFIFCFVLGHLK